MGLEFTSADGQTPLDEDEKSELLIPTITTRAELDEFEQQNIESAVEWTMSRSFTAVQVLNEPFIKELHIRMFDEVWKWAGQFRKTNKNIGVDKFQIGIELRALLDDSRYWIDNRTYPQDEIAIRCKHRLVSIHCFANGNGRHARLYADVLIEKILDRPLFTWGSASLLRPGDTRAAYLSALQTADEGDVGPLLAFARS